MGTIYLVTLNDGFPAALLQDLLRKDGIESFLKNEIVSFVLARFLKRDICYGRRLREGKKKY